MLRSTHQIQAPPLGLSPAPLPPGWTEHKAPTGSLLGRRIPCSSADRVMQDTPITTTQKPSSRPTRDPPRNLSSTLSRRPSLPVTPHTASPQPLREATTPPPTSLHTSLPSNPAIAAVAVLGAATATKTANGSILPIDQSTNTPFRGVRHGCWSRRSWGGASSTTPRRTRAFGSFQRML